MCFSIFYEPFGVAAYYKSTCKNCDAEVCKFCIADWYQIGFHGPMYHRPNCPLRVVFPMFKKSKQGAECKKCKEATQYKNLE
jgi:hypothetical protein